jgi:DNA-binding LacI/PurR family transcriptional regulator
MTKRALVESILRPATARDVARRAGVSLATVSRVVNGAGNVSGEKRTKVLIAASELRYCPNVHAIELGRANRNISKRRGIHLPALVRHKNKRQI